ncbi:MAG: transcription termination/antitermination factor NusG [Clostridia bacterium]|nr:transcription termination/antitermination factor NusG [Clostridia bacterium]MBQ6053651.1 transcription termination/antitermination factor NusG [Clostridia bacterium]
MAQNGKWYVLHTYSSYENKVKTSLETIIENRKLQDLIFDVRIPTETVSEKNEAGETVEKERKLFPGYVLVNMIVNDDTWFIVKNIRGVTGFVGPEGKPVPLTDAEIASLGIMKQAAQVDYAVGDSVRITSGSLENFTGIVDEIDIPNNKVRVTISMFGRETPAELELDQIEVI